jgi:hypothetical protein
MALLVEENVVDFSGSAEAIVCHFPLGLNERMDLKI